MKTLVKIALLSAALVATASVHAAPGPGSSSAQGVILKNDFSDKFVLIQGSNINPIQSTAGFANQFVATSGTAANAWTQAETAQYNSQTGILTLSDKVASDGLAFTFTRAGSGISGTWSVTNTSTTKNTTLDLALSFHAGNNVGSFLVNDQTILAGQTQTGTWAINWLNNANSPASIPGFSNLGIYTGNRTFTSAVPEPSTYAMLLGGLALVGYAARRRKA